MALEVESSDYLFTPRTIDPSGQIMEPLQSPPFRQNALHDLESIWWVAIWIEFYLVNPNAPLLPDHHLNYSKVFGPFGSRPYFRNYYIILRKYTSQFPAESNFRWTMGRWNEELKICYSESYGSGKYVAIDPGVIDQAYDAQKEALLLLREATQGYPSELGCLQDFDPLYSELDELQ